MNKLLFNDIDKLGQIINEQAAFESLKTAMTAYFETNRTFSSVRRDASEHHVTSHLKSDELYKNLYFTSITHFQHFFESVLKRALEQINPFFSKEFSNQKNCITEELYKNPSQIEIKKDKFVSFSIALTRLKKIKEIDHNNPIISKIDLLINAENDLTILNDLRNRIWHRQFFLLPFKVFDLFIGKQVLPLIEPAMKLFDSQKSEVWKYQILSSQIDPIREIIAEYNSLSPLFEKIDLLKEMGFAAYNNPLIMKKSKYMQSFVDLVNKEKRALVKVKVDAICKNSNLMKVFHCPVCGEETLIKYCYYGDVDCIDGSSEFGSFPDKMLCETCSFEVRKNIDDLSLCGIKDNDFWKFQPLSNR